MKKTLALLLAIAFAVPAFAGNIFSNLTTRGEIETIGFTQTDDADQKSVANRVLFGMSMDLVEDVRTNLTFAYNNVWAGWGGDTVDGYLNTIEVAEANVVVSNIFDALEVKIGRQYYGNEDSPVMYIGPRKGYYAALAYPMFPNVMSVDGALLTWEGEKAAFSAFYGQLTDGSDERITGLTYDYAFNNNLTAGIYWYDVNEYFGSNGHIGAWGGKLAYKTEEGSKLAVEYAKNYLGHVFGHNNEGWMLKVDGALNIDMEKVALTPRITYYHTEKNFISLGNYTIGILFANEAVLPLSMIGANLQIVNAGIDFNVKAWEKVTFAFDYFNVRADNEWAGNEWDLTAKYQLNDYVGFTLGGALVSNTDTEDVYGGQLGMLVKF